MDQLPLSLVELVIKYVLIALILERVLSVAFTDSASGLTKLPSTVSLPRSLRTRSTLQIPLLEIVTLWCAIYLSHVLSLHLLASLPNDGLRPAADTFASALFITGLAHLLRGVFARLTGGATAIPSLPVDQSIEYPATHPNAEEGPTVTRVVKSGAFKLGDLKINKTNTQR